MHEGGDQDLKSLRILNESQSFASADDLLKSKQNNSQKKFKIIKVKKKVNVSTMMSQYQQAQRENDYGRYNLNPIIEQ